VLGHGFSLIQPARKRQLAEKIVQSGGLLLSEFSLTFPPDKYTYPARNRLIAGLTLGTVVLEAPAGSGAIITADLALDYGREVFAVPGQIFDPNYEGSHALLARGNAKLVARAEDVMEELGVIAPSKERVSAFEPSGADEKAVYAILTTMPQDCDCLVEHSGLDSSRVNAALTLMELAGGAKNVGGGMWVRT
jgi:DNA processing protein